jgi:hypothetical protein
VQPHRIDPKQLITHHFTLDKMLDAYETFGAAAKTNALKLSSRPKRSEGEQAAALTSSNAGHHVLG